MNYRENLANNFGQDEWLSTEDNTQHYLRCFRSVNPFACVLYLHGIEGHSLWFADTACFLQQNGVSTLALDRRGSGLSREARGDMQSWRQLLSDTTAAIAHAQKEAGSLPLFLMANCWGAKLAVLAACSKQPAAGALSGLILTSPAIDVKVDLSLRQKLKVAYCFLTGSSERLPIPLAVEDFTNNACYLAVLEADDLRLTAATARFFVNTLILTFLSRLSASKIEMPLLVMQSGVDNIVDVEGVERWFAGVAARDKTFQLFNRAHHSLDFDRDPSEYRKLLLSWITDHASAGGNNPFARAQGKEKART